VPSRAELEEAETEETDATETDKRRRTSGDGPASMGLQEKINANPTVYAVAAPASKKFDVFDDRDEDSAEPFEPEEIFGALSPSASACACHAVQSPTR